MDILLIQPYFEDFYRTYIRSQPLGLMYLKATLKNERYDTRIFDFLASGKRQTVPIPASLKHLKEYYSQDDFSPAALYRNYYRFGPPLRELLMLIEREKPSLIGITALFTGYLDSVFEIVKQIRRNFPQIKIIAGGFGIASSYSLLPAQKLTLFDYICYGEGEQCMLKVADLVLRNKGTVETVPNLIFFDKGQLLKNKRSFIENINLLPLPDRSHLDFEINRVSGMKMVSLTASRGCPFDCQFCSVHTIWKHSWRKRSVDNIIREIRQCSDEFKVRLFNFEDDNLCHNRQWFRSLLQSLNEDFKGKDLRFSAMNGINYQNLTGEDIEWTKKAGFEQLNFSISTVSGKNLRKWKRPEERTSLEEIFSTLSRTGQITTFYFIAGSKDQDSEEVLNIIHFLSRKPVYLGPSIYYLTPEQPLAIKNGIEFPLNFELYRSSSCYPDFKNFKAMDKITLLRICRYINYIKSINSLNEIDNQTKKWLLQFLEERKLTGLTKKGVIFQIKYNQTIVDNFFRKMDNEILAAIDGTAYRFPNDIIKGLSGEIYSHPES